MARPRVFISSTFFDLRHVREDLERFIREIGYEPVRHETGSIPYDKGEKLETAAYREVELSDMIVAIIGGRYGSESADDPGYSISQAELRRALERGVQVFIFIERSVHSEYHTYQLNKTTTGVRYSFVDNPRVYEFIEEIYRLPKNNPIASFESSAEIIAYLRVQWAGLFQRFLQQQARVSELSLIEDLAATAKTLRELVSFLTEERTNRDEAIRSILSANHPVFRRLAELTNAKYRLFFTNRAELNQWLRARSWYPVKEEKWDTDSVAEWTHETKGYIKLTNEIFDASGRLKIFSEEEWNPEWLQRVDYPPPDDEQATS